MGTICALPPKIFVGIQCSNFFARWAICVIERFSSRSFEVIPSINTFTGETWNEEKNIPWALLPVSIKNISLTQFVISSTPVLKFKSKFGFVRDKFLLGKKCWRLSSSGDDAGNGNVFKVMLKVANFAVFRRVSLRIFSQKDEGKNDVWSAWGGLGKLCWLPFLFIRPRSPRHTKQTLDPTLQN